jgi:hypothetical protein
MPRAEGKVSRRGLLGEAGILGAFARFVFSGILGTIGQNSALFLFG